MKRIIALVFIALTIAACGKSDEDKVKEAQASYYTLAEVVGVDHTEATHLRMRVCEGDAQGIADVVLGSADPKWDGREVIRLLVPAAAKAFCPNVKPR